MVSVIFTMRLGRLTEKSICRSALRQATGRRKAVQVLSAKKDSSPWSSGGAKRGNSKGGGSSNGSGGNAPGKKAESEGSGVGPGPWKDVPSRRQGLPPKPSKGPSGPGGGGALGGLGGRTASRLAPPPPEATITDPIQVTLLDELSPTETASEPKWPAFCGHLSGEWVGQYAAYTPWEGKPEPAWLDERGMYINVVYTRALEYRYRYEQQQQQQAVAADAGGPAEAGAAEGPMGDSQGAARPGGAYSRTAAAAAAAEAGEGGEVMDVLLRQMGRCTRLAALPDLRLRPPAGPEEAATGPDTAAAAAAAAALLERESDEGEGADIDVEALAFNSDGIVVFDAGNYSAGPEFIGQQEVKLVNDEAIQVGGADLRDIGDEAARSAGNGPAAAAEPAAARTASGAATSSSRTAGGGGGGAAAGSIARAAALRKDASNLLGDDGNEYDEDEDGDEGSTLLPTTTSIFEQCLVDWGSRTRMRLKLTLRIGQLENGELDVEVLRILLFTEEWLGPPNSERLTASLDGIKPLALPCTALPRPTPTQLQGSWNVFTVCATGMDELDPFTGEERVSWLYTSNEEQQLWDASSSLPSGDDGGSYWLPGGVVLSLRMVDNYVPAGMHLGSDSSGTDSERDPIRLAGGASFNGNGAGPASEKVSYPRGLCISMAWLWREGSLSVVEREYDGYGFLREVRLSQAVKGGWSGGRM